MQVSDKLIKPLTEAKYLNADNVSRYRCIMRIFFEHYEKLKYWLYQEEVYEEMIKDPFFADYRPEQCQQDLTMLTEWKNLNTIQDTKKVASIEEFKNKKYRYQMTEYSVEIERLVLRLENLFIEGASLEPTLLERIRRGIERFPEMVERDKNEVYTWWTDLNNDFVRLNQNYQDYIRDLNSVKAEEMMHTKEFLVFKDRLIEYLRSFIKGLQRNVGVIEESLRIPAALVYHPSGRNFHPTVSQFIERHARIFLLQSFKTFSVYNGIHKETTGISQHFRIRQFTFPNIDNHAAYRF